jgi:hypothetical protein
VDGGGHFHQVDQHGVAQFDFLGHVQRGAGGEACQLGRELFFADLGQRQESAEFLPVVACTA